MVQYDDTASDEPVRVYDRGMDHGPPVELRRAPARATARGDVVIPRVRSRGAARAGAAGLRQRDPHRRGTALQCGARARHRRRGRDGPGLDARERRSARVRPLGRAGSRLSGFALAPPTFSGGDARVAGRPGRLLDVPAKGVIAVPTTARADRAVDRRHARELPAAGREPYHHRPCPERARRQRRRRGRRAGAGIRDGGDPRLRAERSARRPVARASGIRLPARRGPGRARRLGRRLAVHPAPCRWTARRTADAVRGAAARGVARGAGARPVARTREPAPGARPGTRA